MNGEGSARLAETQAQEIVTRRLAHDAATAASICAAEASGVMSRSLNDEILFLIV